MTEPLQLTDLGEGVPDRDLRRYLTVGTWRRLAYLAFVATREILTALPHDFARAIRPKREPPLRIETGVQPEPDTTRIALYVHYSATGQISEMVRHQLELLRQVGFSIVFISMANRIPAADWQAVRHLAALVVQRRNFGLDFGAWRDLMPEIRQRWAVPRELLLANDSILGPIHPLAPIVDTMRASGNGLFGLTESHQGGPHLQSYFLLARGTPAVSDLMRFLQNIRISHSKWILVQRGEVRLSSWMRRRGHRVAALFGYDRLVKATISDPTERDQLQQVYKRLKNLARLSNQDAIAALHCWPLNPTHHMWRVLVTKFHYPFLKTELIRKNPANLLGIADWPALVPAGAPSPVAMIKAHLKSQQATATDHDHPQQVSSPAPNGSPRLPTR